MISKKMIMSVLASLIGMTVQAGDIYKENNTTALNQTGSWTGGTVPGADDTAVYTGLSALSTELGADLSWYGISATGNSGIWTITGSDTLTLGAGGITTGGGTAGGVKVFANVNQSVDAEYNLGTGRNFTLNGSLSGSGAIEKTGNGALILVNDNSSYSGTITHSYGLIAVGSDNALGTGSVILNGGTLNAYPSSATVANNITLNAYSTVQAVNTSRNLTLTGVIDGDSGLNVRGAGVVALSGNNTFAGGVSMGTDSGTTLVVGNNNALGSGTLAVSGNGGIIGASTGVSLANDVTMDAGLEVTDAGGNLFLTGTISGSGTLTKSGARVLLVTGDNSGFSGDTVLNAGVLSVGNNNALGSGILTVNGGTLNAYATDRTLDNNIIAAGNTTLETVTVSRNLTLSGVVSGSGSVTKTGAGTLTLSGANTYAGTTTVSAGKMVVDGSLASSLITVADGAVLGGSGTVQAATLLSGSTLAAGNSPGTLTFEDALTLQDGSENVMEITAIDSYDVLAGDGENTLDSAALFVFDFSENTTVQVGDSFDVLSNWGVLVDSGTTFSVLGLSDELSLDTSELFTTGTVSVVPEPTVIGMMVVSGVLLAARRRLTC